MNSLSFPSVPSTLAPGLRRAAAASLVLIGMLLAGSTAQASDASVQRALKAYETRLAADIGYLSSFTAPTTRGAPAALRRLATVQTDLNGATTAANSHQASTRSGRTGRTEVLSALHHASLAATEAQRCGKATRAGHHADARRDAKAEQGEINEAIPLFEAGGKRLHLF
jgi:hypothetical protein